MQKSGFGITDAAGQAVFTYSSLVTDTETLVASVVGANGRAIESNAVTANWVAQVTTTPAPSSATSPLGTSYTATAYVTSGGVPGGGSGDRVHGFSGPLRRSLIDALGVHRIPV